MRVLLVEDDPMIDAAVEAVLQDTAYAVGQVRNGQTTLDMTMYQHYDLLLFDLGLPGKDGHAVLGSLRARDNPVPMLIPTARDAVDGYVHGLDGGADDYILKPFEVVGLLVRIRAVLRRKGRVTSPVLTNGVLTLGPVAREARMGDTEPVRLSACRFASLQALMLRPGAILSRTELEEHIYGWGHEATNNVVEFLIHALREKLDTQTIRNVRGVGWMMPRGQ